MIDEEGYIFKRNSRQCFLFAGSIILALVLWSGCISDNVVSEAGDMNPVVEDYKQVNEKVESLSKEGNGNMDGYIDLSKASIEANSELWEIREYEGEMIIQLAGNTVVDNKHGKVILIGDVRLNYSMEAELKFLGHHSPMEWAGWFGFVIRAKDTENYELVWFMPNSKEETAAFLSVAHGIVPWWTEAYAKQEMGSPDIPKNDWFKVRVDVVKDEVTLYVEDEVVFTKKLAFYLTGGKPGFYVGTSTDAAFRRIMIKDLP